MWVPMKSCKKLVRFPSYLALINPVFHVNMNKKFIGDPESIFLIEGLGVQRTSLMRRFRLKSLIDK